VASLFLCLFLQHFFHLKNNRSSLTWFIGTSLSFGVAFAIQHSILFQFLTLTSFFICDNARQEAEKLVALSYKLRWSQALGQARKQELYELTNLILNNMPKFSGANFFDIEKATLLNILASVGSTLVLLVQFSDK
jgi:hypothetical protein